ncbi:MAG TPA: GFA family protein [Kofleriaceae bacterium]|jgi:hypothetical protein
MKLPMTGHCRCGDTQLRITQPPMLTTACHCTGCQRMTGGAYSLSVGVPTPGFELVAGSPVIGGAHDPSVNHYMCPRCMSWVFTRVPSLPFFVNVRATMLDDLSWFSPFVETFTAEALPFAKTGAPHSYAKLPSNEEFMRLSGEYAAQHES